jgi:hypothetical protein
MVVNIAGMTSGYLMQQGGQHHRNDPEQTNKQVVNITGIIKSTYFRMGGQHGRNKWSTSPVQVVKMVRIIQMIGIYASVYTPLVGFVP